MADIIDTATNANLKTLLTAIEAADLINFLKDSGTSYTVLAPTDEAFAKLPADTMASWLEDIPKLKKILLYHVLFGDVRSDDLTEIDEAPTIEGSVVAVDASVDGIRVNDTKVVQSDILADNGVIHLIDAVLMPALVAGH